MYTLPGGQGLPLVSSFIVLHITYQRRISFLGPELCSSAPQSSQCAFCLSRPPQALGLQAGCHTNLPFMCVEDLNSQEAHYPLSPFLSPTVLCDNLKRPFNSKYTIRLTLVSCG